MNGINMLKATCKSMFCHQCLCFHVLYRDTLNVRALLDYSFVTSLGVKRSFTSISLPIPPSAFPPLKTKIFPNKQNKNPICFD